MMTCQHEARTGEACQYGCDVYGRDVPYCDYCEEHGHEFRACPARDDDPGEVD